MLDCQQSFASLLVASKMKAEENGNGEERLSTNKQTQQKVGLPFSDRLMQFDVKLLLSAVAIESHTSELCCLLPLSSGNETVRHTIPIPICFCLKSPSHIDSTETRQVRCSVDPEEVFKTSLMETSQLCGHQC